MDLKLEFGNIYTKLNEIVYGQEEAVKKILLCIFKHYLKSLYIDHKLSGTTNLLLYGPTGCGKTYLVKQLASLLDLAFIEINSQSISQEGWAGTSFIELVKKGIQNSTGNIEYPIIYIDEFDKLLRPNMSQNNENVSIKLQTGLLKYIEGFNIQTQNAIYNTSNFCFIFSGAFEDLIENEKTVGFIQNTSEEIIDKTMYDKLINDGLVPEFAGRLNVLVRLRKLILEDYVQIISKPSFHLNKWKDLLFDMCIPYNISDDDLKNMIFKAIKKDLGVRGLIQESEELIDRELFKYFVKTGLE